MSATVTSPGRVNLIGEHIDYNGGLVLPAALSVSLTATVTPRSDDRVNIVADDYAEAGSRSFADEAHGSWSDPAVGAMREAVAMGLMKAGADITITSSIPAGAGLSSSAALIVTLLKATRTLSGAQVTDTEIAIAARRVENEYIGVPCGIMDQMAVAVAKPGEAIALDTHTLDYRVVALPPSHEMVVIHSGHSRALIDGRYAALKEECDAAKAAFGTANLCQLALSDVEAATNMSDTIRRRTRHCVTENLRVHAAIEALATSNVAKMGALMSESHASMRDDFEMSIPPVDALVSDAASLGAVGARLTGGGFGGCIVAYIDREARAVWLKDLLKRHPKARFIDAVTAG